MGFYLYLRTTKIMIMDNKQLKKYFNKLNKNRTFEFCGHANQDGQRSNMKCNIALGYSPKNGSLFVKVTIDEVLMSRWYRGRLIPICKESDRRAKHSVQCEFRRRIDEEVRNQLSYFTPNWVYIEKTSLKFL